MRSTAPSGAIPIRILIVDDHPMMRSGLADIISSQPDMCVAGEFDDGARALESFETLRPDVTIMDVAMPEMDGVLALEAILRLNSRARVIMLTAMQGDHQMRRALELGAAGFMMKRSLRKDLIDAIREVHAGRRWIPSDVACTLATHLGQKNLSDREIEVLRSAGAGNSNKCIGGQLGIAEDTVKAHFRTILTKLTARDRTHAVAIAIKRGILTL